MNEKCLIMICFIYTASPRFLGWLDTEKIPVYCEDCGNWGPDNRGLAIHHFQGHRSVVKTTSATSEASRLFVLLIRKMTHFDSGKNLLVILLFSDCIFTIQGKLLRQTFRHGMVALVRTAPLIISNLFWSSIL